MILRSRDRWRTSRRDLSSHPGVRHVAPARGGWAESSPRSKRGRAPSRGAGTRRKGFRPRPFPGQLITFEGIEGSGKTSQMAALADHLEKEGWNVVRTREPGGTRLGEAIRRLLLDPEHRDMHPKTELLLYLASRVQHFERIVLPALQQGSLVLCDRFWDATFAYQGYGRGIDLTQLRTLRKIITKNIQPDLTLLLDVDVKRGLQRANNRSAPDRLERERVDFYEKVRQGYLNLARTRPGKMIRIDSNQDFTEVAGRIRQIVENYLERNVVHKHHRA